jgi:muramoyltetrapeptide carboxypeptidase
LIPDCIGALLKGDKIIIVAPASMIYRSIVERGAELLRGHGFIVEIGEHVFKENGPYAGDDEQRASDLQKALNDGNCKAIWFARGGYGSLRILSLLNWSAFLKKPKWLIGFSDITVFHSYLTKHEIASLHGVMPAFFELKGEETESFQRTLQFLSKPSMDYSLEPSPFNKSGKAEGVLTGGNLSIIQSLRGTSFDISPYGKILFIEDIGEYHYHLDRMMMNLKIGKVLEKISGLIVGHFTDMKEGEAVFGKNANEIIHEAAEKYHYPVLYNFPAGHQFPNWPLLMGSRISLKVTENEVTLRSVK